MEKIFVVKPGQRVSSKKYQKDFLEGETIDLNFASDDDCLALVASGAVEYASKATNAKPVKADKAAKAAGGE